TVVRKIPGGPNPLSEGPLAFSFGTARPMSPSESSPAAASAPPPAPALVVRRDERRVVVAPLAEETFKRAVFERDAGRCTFTDKRGRRCSETGGLEFDHQDGFARTHLHRADRIRLLCRAHNQHAAEKMYGRAFMERARASVGRLAADPGTPSG